MTAHLQSEPLPEIAAALGDTVNATRALVTKFVQMEEGQRSRLLQSENFPECQRAQNEVSLILDATIIHEGTNPLSVHHATI